VKQSFTLTEKLYLFGIAIVILAVNPNTYDPFNVTRFTLLTIFAALILILVFSKTNLRTLGYFRPIVVISLLFIGQMILVLLYGQAPLQQQLYGVFGRNLGFITYVSLVLIMIYGIVLSSKLIVGGFQTAIISIGVLSLFYSLLQWIGLDPFPWVTSFPTPIFGFFGNPNFNSAFLGMTAGALLAVIANPESSRKNKILSGCYIAFSLIIILASNSIQGILVFGVLFLLCLNIIFFKIETIKKFRFPILLIGISALVLAILDTLQKVPWTPVLYKGSITQRGDLWRGAIEMASNYPMFGVGLDSYVDFHQRSRDSVAVSHSWVNELTNDAHNIYLNLLATGGIPLFLIYIALIFLTFYYSYKIFNQTKGLDYNFLMIFLLWFGYLIQAIISINYISLAVIGWASGGLIIGYSKIFNQNIVAAEKIPKSTIKGSWIGLKLVVGLVLGCIIGLPPTNNDLKMYNALSTGKIALLEQVVNFSPKNVTYLNRVAELFELNNLDQQALTIARICTENFPNSAFAWSVIYRSPTVDEAERNNAKQKILEINPYAKL